MNVEIGAEAPIFLFWEYLFQIFGILSLQCSWDLANQNKETFSVWKEEVKSAKLLIMTYAYILLNIILRLLSSNYASFTCRQRYTTICYKMSYFPSLMRFSYLQYLCWSSRSKLLALLCIILSLLRFLFGMTFRSFTQHFSAEKCTLLFPDNNFENSFFPLSTIAFIF